MKTLTEFSTLTLRKAAAARAPEIELYESDVRNGCGTETAAKQINVESRRPGNYVGKTVSVHIPRRADAPAELGPRLIAFAIAWQDQFQERRRAVGFAGTAIAHEDAPLVDLPVIVVGRAADDVGEAVVIDVAGEGDTESEARIGLAV